MAWSTPRTWVAGEKPTATDFNTHVRDQFRMLGDAWATFTSTWSGSTTNPVLGNGTQTAEARQINKAIDFAIVITAGSTTTFGTGQWRLTLPVAARRRAVFDVYYFDSSAGTTFRGIMEVAAGATLATISCEPTTAAAAYRNTNLNNPFAWATGDILSVRGSYEAA